jgi:intracellular multiplication protein IcmO
MTPYRWLVRDVRPIPQRMAEYFDQPQQVMVVALMAFIAYAFFPINFAAGGDIITILLLLYFRWVYNRPFHLPFKIPKYAHDLKDPRNSPSGKSGPGPSNGILYIGNTTDKDNPDCGQEIWFTNDDARTHILYLGTTGSGKTEGLKALATNSLAWGSGFVYVDGKADTDLWASLYAITRRFGRDDDIFVLNYMTGNSDAGSTSNSMNPFSNGSSSYLANMISNFMPDAGGDNAMWKERAIALLFSLMPALVFKRDNQGVLLDVGVVRDNMELQPIVKLSRDSTMPDRILHGLKGYLNTLPGFVDAAFDDEGNEKPPSPDQPMYDLQVARQQHGYLSMQFTRSLQMLADEYGYIFKQQLADIDVLDVVLNRRILVTLIPALEKSDDEAANLGKIVAASLKGMMGMTLGNAVEGTWENAIGSKQTRAQSSFMTIFDEVGYYTARGMAVMAAQARSLGFSLVFASQDLPSMEKKIKTEAKSIVGNCNIKLFGRLEDPTDTKDFLFKHSGTFWSIETTGFQAKQDTLGGMLTTNPYYDNFGGGSVQSRQRVDYDHVREQREGEIHMFFGDWIAKARMFYVAPDRPRALRVHRLLPVPGNTSSTDAKTKSMNEIISRLKDPDYMATTAVQTATPASADIAAMAKAITSSDDPLLAGIMTIAKVATLPASKSAPVEVDETDEDGVDVAKGKAGGKTAGKPSAGQSVAIGQNAGMSVSSLSPSEKAMQRANLPPLYEGDQYAIVEVENAPASIPLTGQVGAMGSIFASTDAELALFAPPGMSDDDGGYQLDMTLPDQITAIIAQTAKRLNQGLGGASDKAK